MERYATLSGTGMKGDWDLMLAWTNEHGAHMCIGRESIFFFYIFYIFKNCCYFKERWWRNNNIVNSIMATMCTLGATACVSSIPYISSGAIAILGTGAFLKKSKKKRKEYTNKKSRKRKLNEKKSRKRKSRKRNKN